MRVLAAMATLLLAACTTWQRPDLDPAAAGREREIDTAECTAAAMQAIPLPSPPQAALAGPAEYSVSGTTIVYGPDGQVATGYVNGTATASGGYDPGRGLLEGQYFQEGLNVEAARQKLANACMLRRGWVKVKARQEPAAAPVFAQAPVQSPAYSAPPSSPIAGEPPMPLVLPAPSPGRYSEWSKAQGH